MPRRVPPLRLLVTSQSWFGEKFSLEDRGRRRRLVYLCNTCAHITENDLVWCNCFQSNASLSSAIDEGVSWLLRSLIEAGACASAASAKCAIAARRGPPRAAASAWTVRRSASSRTGTLNVFTGRPLAKGMNLSWAYMSFFLHVNYMFSYLYYMQTFGSNVTHAKW